MAEEGIGLTTRPTALVESLRLMLAHRPQDVAVGAEDVLVSPEFSRTVGFLDWSRHTEVYSETYDRTTRWVEERLGQNDPRLLAVLGRDMHGCDASAERAPEFPPPLP